MRLIVGLIANMVALFATQVVPGIKFEGDLATLAVAGVVLGVINLVVRPLVMFLSVPLLIVTLGLFYFVVNGLLLYLVSFFVRGYRIEGLVAAILGALVLGVVNWAVHAVLGGNKKD
jgi:putative membrane protein